MIQKIMWKNLEAVELENDFFCVTVIQQLGGKLASVFYKEKQFELAAQNPGKEYKIPEPDADFSLFDASGIDDTFPNINAEDRNVDQNIYHYPDHGEIWSSRMQWEIQEDVLHLWYESKRFSYLYEKWISLEAKSVKMRYRIENQKTTALPCLWTFHGLMRYEEDMELIYPEDCSSLENVLESPQLGKTGEIYALDTEQYCFYRVPLKSTKTMIKYYAAEKVKQGHCGYRYPSQKVECHLHYDEKKLPYLGMWVTAGGFRGDYNCAFEPSNGYYDAVSTAEANGALYELKMEQPFCFELKIEMQSI